MDGSVRWLAKLLINTDVDPRSNEMTVRTGSKTVTFHRPFHLKDVGRMLPPGDYRVVTDEEVIEGLSFTAITGYRLKSLCRPRLGAPSR